MPLSSLKLPPQGIDREQCPCFCRLHCLRKVAKVVRSSSRDGGVSVTDASGVTVRAVVLRYDLPWGQMCMERGNNNVLALICVGLSRLTTGRNVFST